MPYSKCLNVLSQTKRLLNMFHYVPWIIIVQKTKFKIRLCRLCSEFLLECDSMRGLVPGSPGHSLLHLSTSGSVPQCDEA